RRVKRNQRLTRATVSAEQRYFALRQPIREDVPRRVGLALGERYEVERLGPHASSTILAVRFRALQRHGIEVRSHLLGHRLVVGPHASAPMIAVIRSLALCRRRMSTSESALPSSVTSHAAMNTTIVSRSIISRS